MSSAIRILSLLLSANAAPAPFLQHMESTFLSVFADLIKDSFAAPLPDALKNACAEKGSHGLAGQLPEVLLTGAQVSASQAQAACGAASVCIVPPATTLAMDSSLNVAALVIKGKLEWTSATQAAAEDIFLCAGYVAVEDQGHFLLNLPRQRAYIYLKDNGASHDALQVRGFGAIGSDATVELYGRPLARSWSLATRPIEQGDDALHLAHSPEDMGWQIGDRVVVAPMTKGSGGTSDSGFIKSFAPFNRVALVDFQDSPVSMQAMDSGTVWAGKAHLALQQPEVINLSRNVLITGDDFTQQACQVGGGEHGCTCDVSKQRSKCTMGLHTISIGGAVMKIHHVRVEKCGQRGIQGKYCLHLHHAGECPDCVFRGNAIEFGMQRGIIVHQTHLALVEHNVMSDVRGSNIYIEDGNEMYNRFEYNVAICPWKLAGSKYGCTIPGTDNGQADTSLNQAGLWAKSVVNHLIGNRFANSFNGMLYDPSLFGDHHNGLNLCAAQSKWGRLWGNTFHGHGRFGTYNLGAVFPRHTDQTMSNNGEVSDRATCRAFGGDGSAQGLSVAHSDNVDYGNSFAGQYDAGDVQYLRHAALSSNNGIYWKTTVNMRDGCSAHLKDGYYRDTNLALPGGHGTFLLEGVTLAGTINLESNHHCGVGVTGVLCMPVFLLSGVEDQATSLKFQFHQDANNFGGIFSLAPPDQANPSGSLFPAGYCSLVSHVHSWLRNLKGLDGAQFCHNAADITHPSLSASALTMRYQGGILCKQPLRRLTVFTKDYDGSRSLRLRVLEQGSEVANFLYPFFQIGTTKRQGFALPVVPGLDRQREYRLELDGGFPLPSDWIIEFSDTVFANRYGQAEVLNLQVQGRTCPSPVHSQHDRKFIYGGSDGQDHLTTYGRGACTSHADTLIAPCSSESPPGIALDECPDKCPNGCPNGWCDCGSGKCVCSPGFSGPFCAVDTCAAARCGPHGRCSAKFLGGALAVTQGACVCEEGWSGPTCQDNPCAGMACGGHGSCVAQGSVGRCECDVGYRGEACELNCEGLCPDPIPCATFAGKSSFCGNNGGCSYPTPPDTGPNGWCCFYNCDACDLVRCPLPMGECQAVGACIDGACQPYSNRTDGIPCNQVAGGLCLAGECVAPPSTTARLTGGAASSAQETPTHTVVVIGVGAGAGVAVLGLVAAVLCIRWRRFQKRKTKVKPVLKPAKAHASNWTAPDRAHP